ncbi:MAG: carboxypeptidase-like regulatory domain-containing protein, partial [Acidobacteriota bacterium]
MLPLTTPTPTAISKLLRPMLLAACALLALPAARAETLPVTGLVFGSDFAPLEGARAELVVLENNYRAAARLLARELERGGEAGAPSSLQPLDVARSDARGRFALEAPAPGVFAIRVRAPGHLPAIFRPLPAANAVELPPLFLSRSSPVTVRLEGARQSAWIAVRSSPGADSALGGDSERNGWRPDSRLRGLGATGRLTVERARGESLDLAVLTGRGLERRRIPSAAAGDRITLQAPGARAQPGPAARSALRVTGADGAPVAGVIALLGGEALPIGVTDSEGRLEISGQYAEAEPLRLLAADGRSLATWHVTAPPGYVVERRLPALETLVGSTRAMATATKSAAPAAAGPPLAGALVWSSLDPGRFTRASSDGRWRLAGTPESPELWIEGRAAGHLPRLFTAKTRHRWSGRDLELVLERAASLAGQVVDVRGAPLAGVELWLENPSPWPSFRLDRARGRAVTGGDGRFRVEPLWAGGSYRLSSFKAGYLEISRRVDGSALGQPMTLVLEVEKAAFGRVVDLEGRPIEGALVRASATESAPPLLRARADGGAPGGPDAPDPYLAVSDAEGRFELLALPAQVITLQAERSGFAPLKVRGVEAGGLGADGALDLGTLVLEAGLRLTGRVTDRGGSPVEGAGVWRVESIAPSFRHQIGDLRRARPLAVSDSEGVFTISELAPGREVTRVVFRSGFLPGFAECIGVPREEGVSFSLERALTVSGRVSDAEGRAIAGASVTLDPEVFQEGALEPTSLAGDDYQSALTDAEGFYLFDMVTPGRYRASADSPRHQPSEDETLDAARASGGGRQEIDFVLEDGARLTGQTLTEDDEPLAGVRLTVGPSFAQSDRLGRYEILGIPPGEHTIVGHHEDLPAVRESLRIEAGDNVRELIFPFGFEVSGRVSDERGAPVGGVSITLEGGRVRKHHGALSGSDGSFLIEGVGAGGYTLKASREGFAPHEEKAALEVGSQDLRGVRVLLESGGRISGSLLGLEFEQLESAA